MLPKSIGSSFNDRGDVAVQVEPVAPGAGPGSAVEIAKIPDRGDLAAPQLELGLDIDQRLFGQGRPILVADADSLEIAGRDIRGRRRPGQYPVRRR